MAVTTSAVTVTTGATAILARNNGRRSAIIHVPTGGSTVYVGGSDVTTSNGLPVEAGNSLSLSQGDSHDQTPRYEYYGIVAASTQAVRVLEVLG